MFMKSFLIALLVLGVQTPATQNAGKGRSMSAKASGTFEVKLTPQEEGRMSIDKQLKGDIEGTSKGTMLMASGTVEGSAGYVAIEKITGTLAGRKGSFYLQHNGTMNRGKPSLTITVIPDSGTEELVGLEGKMNIIIADGKHSYEFEYTLPAKE
jgi:hypothetical protein